MKTRKILLLAVVIMLVLSFAACNDTEKEIEAPAAPDCFVIEEDVTFTGVTQLDGKVIASNNDYNLVALQKNQISTTGGMQATIKVYDLKTKAVVYENSGISLNGVESLDVSLDNYPVITVGKKVHAVNDEGIEVIESKYSYFLVDTIAKSSSTLASDIEGAIKSTTVGNLYLYGIEDTLYWVSKTGQIVRQDVLSVSDSYADINRIAQYYNIDAEYNGFLYAWEFDEINRRVLVYDTFGVCIVEYNFPKNIFAVSRGETTLDYTDGIVNPRCFVLNDGNILVQYCTEAKEDATAWDLVYMDKRLDVHTAIINYRTGAVTEKDCNFIVSRFESAYAHNPADLSELFQLELTSKYENQAYIVKFENGYLGDRVDYVVLDNALEIKHTFENDYLATSGIYFIFSEYYTKTGYMATAYVKGELVPCVFDHDGKLLKVLPDNAEDTNLKYYVTASGVYTLDGELKYDFEANGFDDAIKLEKYYVHDWYNNRIYLYKFNYETAGEEIYALNLDTFETKLIADGVDVQVAANGDSYVKVYNSDTDVSTLYNSKSEVILKVRGKMSLEECEDVLYVTAKVGTDDLVYVIDETAAQTK